MCQGRLLEDVFLQPWFLPLETANAVRRLLPSEHRHKMRFYFEDYGCMRCKKKRVRYGSNGLCKPCAQRVKLYLLFAIKRRWTRMTHQQPPRSFKRVEEAQRLLRDLVKCAKNKSRRETPYQVANPFGSPRARRGRMLRDA